MVVNRQLTSVSGLEPVALQQLPHQLLGRGDDRVGLVRVGLNGAPHGEEALAQRGPFLFAGRRLLIGFGGAFRGRASSQRRATSSPPRRRLSPGSRSPSSTAPKRIRASALTSLPIASIILRTWRLRPSRISSSTSRSPRRRTRAGAVEPVLQLHPPLQPPQVTLGRRPPQRRAIDLADPVAGMREPVGKLAVVGQQQQAGGVDVEAPDRIEAGSRLDQLDDGLARARLVSGGDDAGRLVDRPHLVRLRLHPPPVHKHLRVLADVAGRVGHDLAADRDPAGGDDLLGRAAGGDAAVGEVTRQAHRGIVASRRPAAGPDGLDGLSEAAKRARRL